MPDSRRPEERADSLAPLGLAPGDRVRWQRTTGGRWQEGTVVGRERDGSISVRDAKGSARALPLSRLEWRTRGPRGALIWIPASQQADATEQLPLL